MIDANAFEKLLEFCINKKQNSQYIVNGNSIYKNLASKIKNEGALEIADAFIEKINELAKPESTHPFNELLKWVTAQEKFEWRTTVNIVDLKEAIKKIANGE